MCGSTTCSAVAHVATQCLPALAGAHTKAVIAAVRNKVLSFIIGYFGFCIVCFRLVKIVIKADAGYKLFVFVINVKICSIGTIRFGTYLN